MQVGDSTIQMKMGKAAIVMIQMGQSKFNS